MELAGAWVGSGEQAVLLVHGFMGTGRNLASLARGWEAVASDLRFFLPDLRGHGRSPPLQPGADLFTLAADLVETARRQGVVGPLRIVGHSLGGRVALAAALAHPEDVGEVVLLDITPEPVEDTHGTGEVLGIYAAAPAEARSRDEMRAFFQERGLSGFLTEWLLTNLERNGEVLRWRVDRQALGDLHRRVLPVDLWGAVGRGTPISCIRGGDSSFVSDEALLRLSGAGCRVATVAGAGHYLHVTHTDEVVALLCGGREWQQPGTLFPGSR